MIADEVIVEKFIYVDLPRPEDHAGHIMGDVSSDLFTMAYGSLDSLFPISMSHNHKLMSPEQYILHDKSAIPMHPGTR